MKSLEQDALKAQMVIAKSKEGKKRGALDQLSESPSPVPTPSPTPMDGEELNSDVVLCSATNIGNKCKCFFLKQISVHGQ